jgi:hypothetical protein
MKDGETVPLTPTVMVIGILDSPHLVRWLKSISELPISLVLFPSTPHRRVHSELTRLVGGASVADVSILRFESVLSIPISVVDVFLRGRLRAALLRRRIKTILPDVVHAIELQHAGYTLLRAVGHITGRTFRIGLTNYGSDIYWFHKFAAHEAKLRALLQIADFYSAECTRDVHSARSLGFTGKVLSVVPNAGGTLGASSGPLNKTLDETERKAILVKGYTNFVGRAQDIIRQIIREHKQFGEWEIIVYSATLRARLMCNTAQVLHPRLRIRAIPKKRLTHHEMIELYSRSAAYVGFSRSDGISTSFLEAISHGVYPLQTSTSCVDEWRGRGFLVSILDVNDPKGAVDELLRVLQDSAFRLTATEHNRTLAAEYLNADDISEQMRDDYRSILRLAGK